MKKHPKENEAEGGQPLSLLIAKAQAADQAAKIAKEKAREAKDIYKASRKAFKQAKKAAKRAAKRAKRAQLEWAASLAQVSTARKPKTARAPSPSQRTAAKPISLRQKPAAEKPVEQKSVERTVSPTTPSEKPRRPAFSKPEPTLN